MPTHKSNDYKLSAVKYYLSYSKNQVQTCKIFCCSERSLFILRFISFAYLIGIKMLSEAKKITRC